MAANDEFPRGETLQTYVVGSTASIIFPAITGISWVLTDFEFHIVDNAGAIAENVFIIDGGVVIWTDELLTTGVNAPDDFSVSGAKIVGTSGNYLELLFGGSAPNTIERIVASAYMI